MSDKNKISVVINTYNAETFLQEVIDALGLTGVSAIQTERSTLRGRTGAGS